MNAIDPQRDLIDAAVTRLFALIGADVPREGSVLMDFHEGLLRKVRPTPVITIQREKSLATKRG